jgi:nucleotide-binding universal stress UspA family protein
MQHILAATDGSRGGDRAIIAAARLAKDTSAALSVLTVGGNISRSALQRLARAEGDPGEALELISNQILEQARRRASRLGVSKIVLRAGWGDAAEVIIETARREKADLIVVGRRGRGRLAGLVLGSVSQKIVSLAPCIVMVVP